MTKFLSYLNRYLFHFLTLHENMTTSSMSATQKKKESNLETGWGVRQTLRLTNWDKISSSVSILRWSLVSWFLRLLFPLLLEEWELWGDLAGIEVPPALLLGVLGIEPLLVAELLAAALPPGVVTFLLISGLLVEHNKLFKWAWSQPSAN